ncbi:hypothetical protein EMPG_16786 [Blastomyces silverae]|uniref:Uncharacterized protein n=1 Tax=Blastomyces silverae TaxID=2060906 RepID=A0A0H1B9N7_9EURO|nr:hypothetical protein EMPG_16786 [Blastomyces silverae]
MLLSKPEQPRFSISRQEASTISWGGIAELLLLQLPLPGGTLQPRRKFPHDIPNPPTKMSPNSTRVMGNSNTRLLNRLSHTDNHCKSQLTLAHYTVI